MNKNLQPDRLFRQPIEHKLPAGEWTPLASQTHHSASAFLLASGTKRLLLTGDRRASYALKGRARMLLEDAPMNRFEIGQEESGGMYLCSALSEGGKAQLIEEGHRLVGAQACSDGRLRFFWVREEDGGKRGALLASRIPLDAFTQDTPEPLLSNYQYLPSRLRGMSLKSRVKVSIRGGQILVIWVTDGIPQALTETMYEQSDGTFYPKRRVLSYKSLGEDIEPLEVWYHLGRIHALLKVDGDLICIRESLERGGNGDCKTLARNVSQVSTAITKEGSLYLAWFEEPLASREGDSVIFAQIESGDLFDSSPNLLESRFLSNRLEIVFDDHNRAHLLLLSRGGSNERHRLRSISWETRKEEILLDTEGEPRIALSKDRYNTTRAIALVTSGVAHLLLPINRSFPVVANDRIGEDG